MAKLLTNWVINSGELQSLNSFSSTVALETTGSYNYDTFSISAMEIDAQTNLNNLTVSIDNYVFSVYAGDYLMIDVRGAHLITITPTSNEPVTVNFYATPKNERRYSTAPQTKPVNNINYAQYGLYGTPLQIVKTTVAGNAVYKWSVANPAPFNVSQDIATFIQVLNANPARLHLAFGGSFILDSEVMVLNFSQAGIVASGTLQSGMTFFDAPLLLSAIYFAFVHPVNAHADGTYTIGYIFTEEYS